MGKLNSFRDLRVYQELRRLHLLVHQLSLQFPKHEMYELGSQIRRSSNSAPANLAEGWGSRHTNIYIESVNRALGEVRETQHHLDMAHEKEYLADKLFAETDDKYDMCGRMLERLHQSLSNWQGSTRTGNMVREESAPYLLHGSLPDWEESVKITELVMSEVVGDLSGSDHRQPTTDNR
jgi:four helix bundle protein